VMRPHHFLFYFSINSERPERRLDPPSQAN